MATTIVIPTLGESISEAVISSWLKEDGAYVEKDEEIVELETDKVTMPLPSPASGVLKHSVAQGDAVSVGGTIGSIDESAPKPAKAAATQPVAAASQHAAVSAPPPKSESPVRAPAELETEDERSPTSRSTPLARKLAVEHKVDLSRVPGTGPGGRVREQDVRDWVSTHSGDEASGPPARGDNKSQSAPAASAAVPSGERSTRRERMSPLRQRIAVRLVEAQHTAAMLTTFNECDMTAVMELRSRHKDSFEKKHGVKLGFMSFFVKAACSAAAKFPNVNAFIVEGEKNAEVEYHDYCDIAVAVGTDKGLVVPVLRNCERLSFAGVERGILEIAAKARDGKLTLEEMQGGTFTISNGGVYGSMLSTPILNPPQSGILGLHNIIRRPVENPAKPGSGEVAVRPMMYLALSYDHRIVDGAGAVGFLKHIKECIENPERLLLDV